MHLVDVAEFFAPEGGGVKTYIEAKLAWAAREGVRVTVVAPGPETRLEPRDGGGAVQWVRAPFMPFDRRYHLVVWTRGIHRLLDALRPDVVEASSYQVSALAVASWRGPVAARARRALVLHGDFVAQHPQTWLSGLLPPAAVDRAFFWYWGYLSRLARRFDRVVAGSRWMATRVAQHAGIAASVVPWGIDLGLFRPERRDPALRAELLATLGLPESARLLVAVGRHHPEKRWPMLFEGVGLAARQMPLGLVQLGDGFDRARVERAAADVPQVRLLGQVKDRARVAAILASADAFVHASRAETFGLVASEALASGLPLVLPDAGGCLDAADPAWTETYAAGRADAAAGAILRLLSRDPVALRAAAAGGRARLSTPDQHFEALMRLYRDMPAPQSGAPVPAAAPDDGGLAPQPA